MSGMLNISNQAAVEALCSGTYLESYLNTLDGLPDDLQRHVTEMRELDIQIREYLVEMEQCNEQLELLPTTGNSSWKKSYLNLQRVLAMCQDLGDEKLHITASMLDQIENRARMLDRYLENLEPGPKKDLEKDDTPVLKKESHCMESVEKLGNKRHRRLKCVERTEDIKEESSDMASHRRKKKRRVVRKDQEPSPIHLAVDPNEPTYCLCNQVSYGDMIGCDNVDCEVEWFHFNCVQLTHKPKGKWYCPRCRGERPNVPLKRTDK